MPCLSRIWPKSFCTDGEPSCSGVNLCLQDIGINFGFGGLKPWQYFVADFLGNVGLAGDFLDVGNVIAKVFRKVFLQSRNLRDRGIGFDGFIVQQLDAVGLGVVADGIRAGFVHVGLGRLHHDFVGAALEGILQFPGTSTEFALSAFHVFAKSCVVISPLATPCFHLAYMFLSNSGFSWAKSLSVVYHRPW